MENAISFDYFVYSRPAGERRFAQKMARLRRRHLPRRSLPGPEAGRKNRRIHDALSKILSASDKITSTAAQRQERKNIL